MDAAPLGFFGRIAAAVLARPKHWSLCIGLFTLLMGVLATRLQVDPNILELLPEDDPTTQAIQRLNEQEGGTNLLTITVNGEEQEVLNAFMLELKAEVEALETVDYVLYELDTELLTRIGLMQQDPADLYRFYAEILQIRNMGPAWQFLPDPGRPFREAAEAVERAEESHTPFLQEGSARILVRPTGSAYDPEFSRPFMADIYDRIDALEPEARGLEVAWVGGAYRHAVEDLENVIHDLGWTAGVSLGLVLVFLSLSFRDPRVILLLFLPLIVGNIWTLGYANVTVGTLNTFTSFVAAILIGLGVDFAIHLYARYREKRIETDTVEDAVIRAWDSAGPPCMTAAITSAGGFCALWAAGFQGFQQLGTLLAGGVLFCLFAVLTVLPLLIVWRERTGKPVPLRVLKDTGGRSTSRYRFSPYGLCAIVLVTLVAGTRLPHVNFEYDISELRARGLAFEDLDEQEQRNAQDSYAPIVVSYDSNEDLRNDHRRLDEQTAAEELVWVDRVLSAYTLVPLDQDETYDVGEETELSRTDILERLVAAVQPEQTALLESSPILPQEIRDALVRLRELNPAPIEISDLPRGFRDWLSPGDGASHRLMLIPRGNMWDIRNNLALKTEVEENIENGEAAGEYLAMAVLYQLVEGDSKRVVGLALCAVLVFCLIDLRKPALAVGALLALVTGLCWAGAGMAGANGIDGLEHLDHLEIRLSLVNFVGIPILMGIGIDVIIHLMHRIKEEGKGRIRWALFTTGWACGLSAATTILSFASLSVAQAQGVRSLGTMIVLGLSLVTLAAFLVVPVGWTAMWRLRQGNSETEKIEVDG